MSFRIEVARDGHWTTEGLGDPAANDFDTREDAVRTLNRLLAILPDWRGHQYRVVAEPTSPTMWRTTGQHRPTYAEQDPVYRQSMRDAGRGGMLR